jgi:hypothetical protein
MAGGRVPSDSVASQIGRLLDSPEIVAMISKLDALRWTGRKGYGARTLVGACLVKSVYAIPTWTRVAALIAEHAALQASIGGAPSHWACYRFATKLREQKPLLDACLLRVADSLREQLPEMGRDVAIDASDMPAYANGQRFLSKNGPERERFSDPDASWGHRSAVSTRKGGGYYGYKIHAAICTRSGLPLAWQIATARDHESPYALPLLDAVRDRGFRPETCAMDKGYDSVANHAGCTERHVHPVISYRERTTCAPDDVPTCEHGRWTFAGADFKRGASKWRCPSGVCAPKSVWLKADRRNPIIPRETKRWRDLYRGRAAIEREFGTLKHHFGLAPLRVRGLARVQLHADLTMLARLSQALARARDVALAA